MNAPDWLNVLETLAPPDLAAEWDNTGLLCEGTRDVRTILTCIDLTEAVVAEIEALDADLVVAYHPPIFGGLTSLRGDTPKGRALLAMVRAGRHVYSPHTSLDAVVGGVNDWLLEAFGALAEVVPIEPASIHPEAGVGRRATLREPIAFETALTRIAKHLEIDALQVAGRAPNGVKRVAVCPGAGGSVLRGCFGTDLLLTGEMRHHDVLAAVGAGSTVVLTRHTHTERGYLERFAANMVEALPDAAVHVSTVDDDPLQNWTTPRDSSLS